MKNSAVKLNIVNNVQLPEEILVGKDVLELISGAMYVDPLNIFREYVQNATDSIDLSDGVANARIDIELNPKKRRVVIRDNGAGLSNKDFPRTMTAIGGSRKRIVPGSRGFRGVGRLAGLGYCRSLSFRSKSDKDSRIIQITWDCVRFKNILRDSSFTGNLQDVIREVSTLTSSPAKGRAAFFEVVLDGIIRLKNDVLLNSLLVKNYLSQVAPVPFHLGFEFRGELNEWLEEYEIGSSYCVTISDANTEETEPETIYRPHRNEFMGAAGLEDCVESIKYISLPGINGDIAAIGWIADNSYFGAIPHSELINGIRFRVGNIQVGESNIVAEEFPESRFNSWCIGELHVLTNKILPNGRRDNFEENTHYDELLSQLQPHLREIAQVCRQKSSKRQWTAKFMARANAISQDITLLENGSVGKRKTTNKMLEIETGILGLEEQITSSKYDWTKELNSEIEPLKERLTLFSWREQNESLDPLAVVPYQKRLAFQEVLELVYDVSANKEVGNTLIEKVIKRLASKYCA